MQVILLIALYHILTARLALSTSDALLSTQYETDISDIIHSLVTQETGYLHLGDDAILRSYNEFGEVLDFARFNRTQLQFITGWFSEEHQDHLLELWKNVDNSLVDDRQIWYPPDHLKFHPSQLSMARNPSLRGRSPVLPRIGICERLWCDSHAFCLLRACSYCFMINKVADPHCVLN
ncbi:hypothetical protein I7I48_11069 [Histoplasma ohiense]|nr:hypothetical protein I7I48_11069 [Histoplasma ohiense (nom. inval.)]